MKMEKIDVKDSHRLINAGSVILISCRYNEMKTVTPIAWHAPVSGSPKLFGVAVAKKHFSMELIERSGSYCINLPEYSLLEQVKYCGSVSGRNTDKFTESGLTYADCTDIDNIYIPECIARIECEIQEIIPLGDHNLAVGLVRSAWCNEGTMTDNETVDIRKYSLVQHLGGEFFGTIAEV